MRVAFIGLGKLGMPVAECMAGKHHRTTAEHEVHGFDVAPKTSDKITIAPTMEAAITGAELIFIAVPTPHDPVYDGRFPSSQLPLKDFDYTAVKNVLKELRGITVSGQVIVLISTCLPGTCRREFAHLIESGVEFIYNPYFIAMGTVAADFVDPEFVLMGTRDGDDSDGFAKLVDFYDSIMGPQRWHCMTWTEAEAAKVFYNTFISFKLSFVNMIQDVAEVLGDIDVDAVTGVLGTATKRLISPMYMKAGMGDGGPCHPRDNIALSWLANKCDLKYDLFGAIMKAREEQAKALGLHVAALAIGSAFGHVIFRGKAFKPGVDLIDGSYSLLVAFYAAKHTTVYFDDPLTGDRPPETLKDMPAVVVLTHPDRWNEPIAPRSIIVDMWRQCPKIEGCTVIHYGNTRGHA